MSDPLLLEIDGIVARGGDVDDILRAIVETLAGVPSISWAGIRFAEGDELVLGPAAGSPDPSRAVTVPIAYQCDRVGELEAHGDVGAELLAQVADRAAAYALLGWDTGGEVWEP